MLREQFDEASQPPGRFRGTEPSAPGWLRRAGSVSLESPTAEGTQPIRILHVDDHSLIREGVRAMLQDAPGVDLVGEATSGEEALERIEEIDPTVVLLDIRMEGMDGIETTRRIKRSHPDVSVVILSAWGDAAYVSDAVRAGASTYLTKGCSRELLLTALRVVTQGGALFDQGVLPHLVQGLSANAGRDIQATEAEMTLLRRLTPREMDILRLLARGYSNKDICAELNLAQVTVKKHVQSICTKLRVSQRTQAAILGVRLGLSR